jgi:hypothetical protein
MLECVDAGIYLDDPEELAEMIAELTDVQVKRWVDRNYAGGWPAFFDCALACHNAPRRVMTPEGWQFITVDAD